MIYTIKIINALKDSTGVEWRMKDVTDIVNIGAKKTGKVPVIRHVRC